MLSLRRLSLSCVLLLVIPVAGSAGKRETLPAGAERAGFIASVRSNVHLVRNDAPFKAHYHTDLTWNDAVQTDPNGRASIRLSDQSILSVGSNSELHLLKPDPQHKITIELAYGLLRAQIKRTTQGEPIEVRTPTASAGVIGTDFGVDASVAGRVTFICLEGSVEVRSIDPNVPGSVKCEAGSTVVIEAGRAPEKQPGNDRQMAVWRNITDPDEPPPFEPFP
jgi:ferric-dicitrate binding protein FerR (iron transport regulator)